MHIAFIAAIILSLGLGLSPDRAAGVEQFSVGPGKEIPPIAVLDPMLGQPPAGAKSKVVAGLT